MAPFPSIADFGYAGTYPLTLSGLLLQLPMRQHTWSRRWMLGLDAATIVGAGFMVIWSVSLGPAVHVGFGTIEAALNVILRIPTSVEARRLGHYSVAWAPEWAKLIMGWW